jgi:hypothetical protein
VSAGFELVQAWKKSEYEEAASPCDQPPSMAVEVRRQQGYMICEIRWEESVVVMAMMSMSATYHPSASQKTIVPV